jgi:hypothetical protein
MAKLPPWEITVARKSDVIAEFQVPGHRFGDREIAAFLRALAVRYRTDTPQDMLDYYVNKRKGRPQRLPLADVQPHLLLEKNRSGFFCGDWECYAMAMQEMAPGAAEAARFHVETEQKGQ